MQAARAARAVDQIIHKHLQDWNSEGTRFEWAEDQTRFTLATFHTMNSAAAVTAGAPKLHTHLTVQADNDLPVEYNGPFGCTTAACADMIFWLKDIVEMTLSVKELIAS